MVQSVRRYEDRDPSPNVLMWFEAAIKRQDDLRQMEAQDIRELMNTHFEHIKEISIAETDRIDALRVVDILAVATANENQRLKAGQMFLLNYNGRLRVLSEVS